jgi:hypothetical protein
VIWPRRREQPLLETVLRHATRLCHADAGPVYPATTADYLTPVVFRRSVLKRHYDRLDVFSGGPAVDVGRVRG